MAAQASGSDSNTSPDEFLAFITRDARTLLSSIIGYSEMLVEELEEDASAEMIDDLKRIGEAGERVMDLVAALEWKVEEERRARLLADTLRALTGALTSTLETEQVFERLIDSVSRILPYDRAQTWLVVGDGVEVARVRGYSKPDLLVGRELDVRGKALFDGIFRGGVPMIVPDPSTDRRVDRWAVSPETRSWMVIPLVSRGETLAVLTLENDTPGRYGRSDAEVAETFCGHAGIAIDNARLFGEVKRLATVDALTGTYNRRHFFQEAGREFKRAQRTGRPLAVALLDIDHFKNVNDTLGHTVGDEVLRELARRCASVTRDADVLGRYGGEEFVILLPETDAESARTAVAERLRRQVADRPVMTSRGPVQVTISVGVASVDGTVPDVETLIDRADAAMYESKRGGRNRVSAAAG